MLKIRGYNIEECSKTLDTNFLGEIMEWNEQVEETNTKESLENLKKDIDIVLVNLYKCVDYLVFYFRINIKILIT